MKLSSSQAEQLLEGLKIQFAKNSLRHQGISWVDVALKLKSNIDKLNPLYAMEQTGGEPDVIALPENAQIAAPQGLMFFDCSEESPKGRRSLCYDEKALQYRKENKPRDSAIHLASEMGVEILTEHQYRFLQQLGTFDNKTSSWVHTPDHIRKLGGALFCDRRFDTVFLYHNGAESYYAGRGFRACYKI